jgi:hypothetical protein
MCEDIDLGCIAFFRCMSTARSMKRERKSGSISIE